MKKLIIGGIIATAIAVVLNINISAKGDNFSDTFLANVEALAANEDGHNDYWCCAPYTQACAGNEHMTIHGTLKTQKCY